MNLNTFTQMICMKKQIQFLPLLLFFSCFLSFGQNKNDSIKKSMDLKQPDYLKKGDTIAIVAPAGILKNKKDIIDKAQKLLESWGLYVVLGKHVFAQNHHFAGTDVQRAEDFQKALDNSSIKAIWAARGGYGSVRILDRLNYTEFLKNPKWIIGYSDITAFHNHIHGLGVETIHAMMGTSLMFNKEETEESIATFKKALFGEPLEYQIEKSRFNKMGKASGQLVGGNLSILGTMLGSKSQLQTDGKILFIEEIGEYKYYIDRVLQSLKRAGYFDNLNGVIVGNMSKIRKNTTKWGSSIEKLILDALQEYDFPILFDFPAGHENDNRALIMGRTVTLNVTAKKSEVLFK